MLCSHMTTQICKAVLSVLGVLAVGFALLNRQDAKDAKQSEKTTNQTKIPLASSFIKAITLLIFVPFRVVRCLKSLFGRPVTLH